MQRKPIVFIESNTSGTGRLFVRAAVNQGYRPILLTNNPARYNYIPNEDLEVIIVDTQSKSAVLDACRKIGSRSSAPAGVTSSSEYFIELAATIAEDLGLPGPKPGVIARCRDKSGQLERLNREGVSIPKFISVSSPEDALVAAVVVGFPVVLKPVCGSGSMGVRLCRDEREVLLQAEFLLGKRTNERGMPIPQIILVEEFIVGDEYSVEIFGTEIIGITRKFLGPLPEFVEIGHDYPGILSSEEKRKLCSEVIATLQALRIHWGPIHCEARIREGKVFIIEVNPRLAGGYIPELIRLAHGIDLVSETIKAVVGLAPNLEKGLKEYASIRFIVPDVEGEIMAFSGLDEAQAMPGVVEALSYKKLGDCVFRNGDFRDRIGHVIAKGKSSTAASSAAINAHGIIKPKIAPVRRQPEI